MRQARRARAERTAGPALAFGWRPLSCARPHVQGLSLTCLLFAAHIARGAIESVGGKVVYPIVPGHELAGVCTAVGPGVTKFKVRLASA